MSSRDLLRLEHLRDRFGSDAAEEKAELQGRLDEMDRRRASWARRAEAAERSLEELVFKNHDLAHERAVDLERRVQRALAAIEGDER